MSEAAVTELEAEATPEVEDGEPFDADRAKAKIAKANSEAKGLRARVKELEQYEAKAKADEDAKKSEVEKARELAEQSAKEAAEARAELIRERIARRHGISDEDMDLLGSGTEEQIEARAQRLAAKNAAAAGVQVTAPPSGKPVEKLRPGATSTEKSIEPPDAYPSSWRTAKTQQTRKD